MCRSPGGVTRAHRTSWRSTKALLSQPASPEEAGATGSRASSRGCRRSSQAEHGAAARQLCAYPRRGALAAPLTLALAGAGAPAAGWQADRAHAMLLQAGEAGGESNSPTSRPELPLISGGADSAPALPPHTPQRFATCAPSAAASPPSAQVRLARLGDKGAFVCALCLHRRGSHPKLCW